MDTKLRAAVALATALAWAAAAPAQVDECADPGPGWIFCSGFEEGDLSVWDDYDGNPPSTNLVMPLPGPRDLAGNHVMRLRVPPGTGGADLVKVLPGTYDRLYARWYVQWEPGYDFTAPNHGGGLMAGDRSLLARSGLRPDGTNRFIATLEPNTANRRLNAYAYYRGMYQDCADPDGACWGDRFPCLADEGQVRCTKPAHRDPPLPPQLETGRWYCIEMLLDGGTPTADGALADGVLDIWIDGEQLGPWDDLWLRTTPELRIGILWLNLYHHAAHSVEGLYLDNVVVSTEPIGCLGTGTPGEGATWGGTKSRYR